MSEQKPNGAIPEIVKNMNWPTVILIILSGGGNWLATQGGNSQNQYAIEKARHQVDEIFNKIDEFENRQKLSIENQNKILDKLNRLQPSSTPHG